MTENISVDKAITRGHLMVNVPVLLSMVGTVVLGVYLAHVEIIPEWGIGLSVFVGISLSWLTWSIMITKWRIWAFENVRNVHELKKKAISAKLIWDDNSWFGKTEIRTSFDRARLAELEKKFLKSDIHREDFSVPPATTIFYSKATALFELVLGLACSAFGLYTLHTTSSFVLGFIFTVAGAYFAFRKSKQAINRNPQVIIDSKGIKTINTEFIGWEEIKKEEVIHEGYGKNTKHFLKYVFRGGREKIRIDDFDITPKELENLLKTYRIRYEKHH